MDHHRRRRLLGVAAIALAVLGLLMLTAVAAQSLPGTTRSLDLSWTIDALQLLKVAAGLAVVGGVLWLMIGRTGRPTRARGKEVSNKRGTLMLLLILGVLALLIWLIPDREPAEEAEQPAPEIAVSEEFEFLPTENVGQVWPLLALVGAVAVAAFAVRLVGRPEDQTRVEPEAGAILADTLADAIEALSWAEDPRSVIIRAYHEIERALGAHGLPRLASEAPREYLGRVLRDAHVDPSSITRLTELFERARFSDHELSEAERAEAINAMETVRDELVVDAS